jgi:hypothetical protein
LLASCTSIFTPKRSSNAFQVASVSANSTPVSIVTTLTASEVPWSSRSSSSSSTDSSFWNEHIRTARSPWRAASRSVWVRLSATSDTELIERDPKRGLWKYNPLAHWTDKDLWRRIHERGLPYHPLHDKGYASIGCAPCTLPGSGREGRWAGTEKTECGLHVEAVG